ncbi:MAG: efflux RND transporter periplasmic adaptor subunit [Pseudomonadota bacterium]
MRPFSRHIRTIPALACLILLAACGDAPPPPEAPSALAIAPYTAVEADSYEVAQRFSGQVEAARRSSLGFELGGELAAVLVDEGATVSAGTVLARLDTARLIAARAEASAAVDQSRAQAELAAATLKRVEGALEFDGVSIQEVDEARERSQRTDAAAIAAEAQLRRIEIDLAKAEIRAPYDAAVVGRFADEGQVLGAGQAVLEVQEAASLEVRLSVTGDVVDSLANGARVELDIDGRAAAATVGAVIARRDLRTRAIEVILELDDGAPARVGDIAELRFDRTVRDTGFWVPVDALTEGARGVWNVLAVREGDRGNSDTEASKRTGATHVLERRPVEIIYQEADRVFVRGALEDGDTIVGGGLHRVVAGQGVRIAPQLRAENDAGVETP